MIDKYVLLFHWCNWLSCDNSFIYFCLGSFLDILHNSYVKGGLALGSLLGPGRG